MASTNRTGNDIIVTMEGWFKNAPALSSNLREGLVGIAPILALVFGIIAVLLGLGAIGASPIALFGGVGNSMSVMISGLLAIITGVLMLMAYPKLKAHRLEGWTLIFWSVAIGVVSTLLMGDVLGALLRGAIGFYLLFQVKSYYK